MTSFFTLQITVMNELTRQSILQTWKKWEIEPVEEKCATCGNFDLCQHQHYCVECMLKNAKFDQQLQKKHEGRCAMCDKKLTDKEQESVEGLPYLKNNVCNKCLKSSF